jgi:hypothetical protein
MMDLALHRRTVAFKGRSNVATDLRTVFSGAEILKTDLKRVGFEVLTAVAMNVAIFRVVRSSVISFLLASKTYITGIPVGWLIA